MILLDIKIILEREATCHLHSRSPQKYNGKSSWMTAVTFYSPTTGLPRTVFLGVILWRRRDALPSIRFSISFADYNIWLLIFTLIFLVTKKSVNLPVSRCKFKNMVSFTLQKTFFPSLFHKFEFTLLFYFPLIFCLPFWNFLSHFPLFNIFFPY